MSELGALGVPLDLRMVRLGVALHDAGKVLHPAELDQKGALHEPAGEELLLARGVEPALARVCVSHARWGGLTCSLEELLVALSDTLWKGARKPALETMVIDAVAQRLGLGRWDLFIALDSLFEKIAQDGPERLARSGGSPAPLDLEEDVCAASAVGFEEGEG